MMARTTPTARPASRTQLTGALLACLLLLPVAVAAAEVGTAGQAAGAAPADPTRRATSSEAPAGDLVRLEPVGTAGAAEMARLLEQASVATNPPRATIRDWIAALTGRFGRWLQRHLQLTAGVLEWIALIAQCLAIALLALGIVAIIWVLARALRRQRRDAPTAEERVEEVAPSDRLTADAWLEQLDEALARGSISEALTALWSWLVLRVAGPEPDPAWTSWTTGELLRISQRADLKGSLGRLDAIIYGTRPASTEAIRCLAESLRSQV